MVVKIAGKEMEFDVSVTGTGEIFEAIRWELNKKNMVISSIIVNGEEIFNHHEDYVNERLGAIQVLEVKGATKAALALENAALIEHHIRTLMPQLAHCAKDFREGMTENGWNEFEGCIRTLLFIEEVAVDIYNKFNSAEKKILTQSWKKALTEYQKLNDVLKDLEEYLDHNQESKAADAVEQEILPILEKTAEMIGELL